MAENNNGRRTRRTFTAEYKAEVVRLVIEGGKSSFAVAKQLGISASVVRGWVKQAEIDRGGGGVGALTSAEREELAELRREVKNLRIEREILRKATVLFAREGTK
jgi:transposase